MGKATQKHTV